MKTILVTATLCLLFPALAQAQDAPTSSAEPSIDWLKKFEGNWTTIARSPDGSVAHEGSITSRWIGDKWLVNEIRADMGGFAFQAQQTLAVDQKKKVFTATWIDNALDFKWNYEGRLDEAKKQLIFDAEGPAMSGDGALSSYRDIYEFRSDDLIATTSQHLGDDGNWKTFMTGEMKRAEAGKEIETPRVMPHLMFEGNAEKAMRFYVSIFPDSKVEEVTKYDEGENGKAGSIKHATFRIAGTRMICIDSPAAHPFEFTPSLSLFVQCENQKQIETVFKKLSEGGKVLMPLDDYGFSTRFGWLTDQFGVSWQLNFGELK